MRSLSLSCPPDTSRVAASSVGSRLELPRAGRQWLAVEGYVVDRFLVTYRAPAARLAPRIPAPFTLDTHRGHGFISVCALEVRAMGIVGTPRWLRFHNVEVLYRVGVRFRGESTFITLRSDTASAALALVGGWFSHYRLRRAEIALRRASGQWSLRCASRDGTADATLDVDPRTQSEAEQGTLFESALEADRFLLGMSFSADADARGRVLVQRIEHSPWRARFVRASARFAFLERFAERYGVPLTYDSTLAMRDIQQTWLPARRVA